MIANKVLLITGGTSSFGKKLISTLLENYKPRKIIIFSRDEFKQDLLYKELSFHYRKKMDKIRFFLGDIRDKDRLYRAFNGVDHVIHIASMRQVSACEYNPLEAIKTNILGTQNIIDAAIDCGVKRVVALSSDEAVTPINLYGGTKLVSDKLFISANAYSRQIGTIFSVVRYSNVAGSRGSVIPFFKQLIDQGIRELPIEDFNMTKFWITLEKGVAMVLKALGESKGGETYIPKMPSFKITDLARAMVPNCKLKEVGIREWEKLHEVMITKDESYNTYEYENHYVIYPHLDWWNKEKYLTLGGNLVEADFEYSSRTNKEWYTINDLILSMEKLGLYDENNEIIKHTIFL